MPSANDKRCGFEIKLGANQVDSAADGLLKVQKEILKERRETGQNTVCTLRLVQCRIPKTGWRICRSVDGIKAMIRRKERNHLVFRSQLKNSNRSTGAW